jgi:hypothetical protein
MDHIVVFRLQLRAAVRQQQLHEGVQKLDIALSRFECERIDSWTVLAHPIDLTAIQFDHALVAAADIENVGESAVFLLQCHGDISMN